MVFGRLWLDASIPHHAAAINASSAGLGRLNNPLLLRMATDIIQGQMIGIRDMRRFRDELYGGGLPAPLAPERMAALLSLPEMAGVDKNDLLFTTDPTIETALLCGAQDPDKTFIDLMIPHHRVEIVMSEALLAQDDVPQVLRGMAERAIEVQRLQIQQMQDIREDLYGVVTPAAS